MAKDINIGGRLHSIATGNVVAGADEILDDNLGKKQTQINTETYSLVESVNNALDALNPDQQEALAVAAKANANEAKLGYYVCDTNADTAAKTIAATGYVLTTGGNIRIKMTNANTADAVTLNINSTGAKALFYNGTQASSTNSWEAGEVLEVYYDGTNYQASNTQGGGNLSIIHEIDTTTEYTDKDVAGADAVQDISSYLNRDVFGNVSKTLVWQNGAIDTTGLIRPSAQSQFSQPFTLKKGETIIVGTTKPNITIIGTTISSSVAVNDSVSVIQTTTNLSQFETYAYTAEEDIKLVVCVSKADYTVDFSYSNSIVKKIEPIINAAHKEKDIDIASLQIYRNDIHNGQWRDINSTSRKCIIIPTKKGFTYRLSVPNGSTVYYCMVTDISNAMTNNSPVAFGIGYGDKVSITEESVVDIVSYDAQYLWIREDAGFTFTFTVKEIGNDYEYIQRSEIEDSLDSDSPTKVLSARQGKALGAKVEHIIDYSSAGKNWGTRYTEGIQYTLAVDPDNPRLITYNKLTNMPGSGLTLLITGLEDGSVYHFHMEYTSTSSILNGTSIYKLSARNITSGTSLNIDESKLLGAGQYTMDFDFTYDASNPYYGWHNDSNFSNRSTLTITALNITQTKDIHDIYEMVTDGGGTSANVNDSAILDEARHIATRNTNTNLHLLHFTDIHGDGVAADKIMNYVNRYSNYIDDIIDTGDTVYDQYTDGVSFMTDSGLDVAFRTIGNHDTWLGVTTTDKATVYNYIFAPFVEQWTANGMIQPADAATNNVMYWYKDYADKKVRLIGLDCMYQDNSQLSWFLDLLSETLDSNSSAYGYTIVVASHVIPAVALQATFLHNADGELSSFCQYDLAKIQNSPAIYFDDAYINGVDSFIEQGGKFGIWLCGHTHSNVVFYTKDHPNILVLNAAAAGNRVGISDSASSGTENQYLANVISIDTTNKLIKIIRVGRKYDKYLRAANVLTIDYANKKVITNY